MFLEKGRITQIGSLLSVLHYIADGLVCKGNVVMILVSILKVVFLVLGSFVGDCFGPLLRSVDYG
jgi:hypothetical protein